MELLQGATSICEGSCRLTFLERQEVWNDCMSCKVRISSNGNLLWEASVFLGRKKVETLKFAAMPFGLTNAPTVFMELMSREEYESHVKMIVKSVKEEKLYVKFSNNVEAEQRGSYLDVEGIKWTNFGPPFGRDVRTLAIEEANTTQYSIHPGADTMLCGFRLTNRWLSMKKDIASCGSKYLAYSEVEVEYQGPSGKFE
ncbi:hypothetical protein Tco_1124191 [Tanacetum coccineum]|uniref:Uncharacterized protein n=1 Tax=Tanacetum coccineum TaxID=301880 RepID=A0ABQ5J6J6_9ASTR